MQCHILGSIKDTRAITGKELMNLKKSYLYQDDVRVILKPDFL